MQTFTGISILLFLIIFDLGNWVNAKNKRSIDLAASHSLITEARLTKDVTPQSFEIHLRPILEEDTFTGNIKMNLTWNEASKKITFHAHYDLNIDDRKIKLTKYYKNSDNNVLSEDVPILRTDRIPKKNVIIIFLKDKLEKGSSCVLEMDFQGTIWESPEGLFKGRYVNSTTNQEEIYFATHMRPHNARRLFPCFDEPSFKVPYNVSISRPVDYTILFNMPLIRTEVMSSQPSYVIDYFQPTPPMSSFTFGFVISKLKKFESKDNFKKDSLPKISIWANDNLNEQLEETNAKIFNVYGRIEEMFNVSVPLPKIDIIVIPGLSTVRPSDNWGLLVFKESEVLKKGYFVLTQELLYQWIGCWVTPNWWNDAHMNKALVSFLAAEIVTQVDGGVEFNGKYPMTVLYSLYYEFSKRYPHSRITGMKQETSSFKTELVIRMLNFTMGRDVFKAALRKFVADRHFGLFYGDDFWDALTKQAVLEGCLDPQSNVAEIAGSWITKDRLPVVDVQRHYLQNTATVKQKVYLRERPHDVPEQDKMLWWIPIILNREDNLNFRNTTPYVWMKQVAQVQLEGLPDQSKFIIINPEEIGPFPVNYDQENWNMLSTFLQTESGRELIPTYTRAKLLHDGWNLAYAGDLSFATAFNMTLFLKFERNHIVWNPVFTFIDHIGRHIDMSDVHKKFETYVRALLAPLYEELGEERSDEESWKSDLRSLAKTFLCRAGYKPCIQEAQNAFQLWKDAPDPDTISPVPNQYICPVFKWGTADEWEFGLQRVLNFPKTRVQSERTYLLKTLVGCPVQPDKITRILKLAILENNTNFTENDIFLIFRMLTGGSTGYMTLFNFLSEHWVEIHEKFENKTNLWDSLISSATGVFTTKEGYDKVKKLHELHSGDFGSAEHIIVKSLRNIKEEAKWSDANLPVIEKWLDNFLSKSNHNDNKFIER